MIQREASRCRGSDVAGEFQIASAGWRRTEKIAKPPKIKKVFRSAPCAATTVDANRIDLRPRATSITTNGVFLCLAATSARRSLSRLTKGQSEEPPPVCGNNTLY